MIDLEVIKSQNPWWISQEKILEDEKVKEAFSRKHRLLHSFESEENFLFFGPRQTGKTTFFKLLIHDLIMNKSCEILRNFEEIIELIKKIDFLIEGKKYVFLDEISFVEEWQRGVKFLLDSPLKKEKVLYITGSSSINLKKESFPGRPIKIKEFLPLTFREFANLFGSKELKESLIVPKLENIKEIFKASKELVIHQSELDKLFYKYLECGGFPRAMFEYMEEGNIKNSSYEIYWNWLIHDIAKIERSEKIVSGILFGILKNYATKFSLNSLSKEIEIASHVTVREYLKILEDLYALRNFYTFNLNKKLVVFRKMRKVYFIDPFLYHVTQRHTLGRDKVDDYSKIVEGISAEALARKIENKLKIGFYHNKREIDICFENFGIEVKWQEAVHIRDFPKVNVKNKILISKNDFEFYKEENLLVLPASIFLAMM